MERKLKYEVVNVMIRYSILDETGASDYMLTLSAPLAKEIADACDLEIAKAIERSEGRDGRD